MSNTALACLPGGYLTSSQDKINFFNGIFPYDCNFKPSYYTLKTLGSDIKIGTYIKTIGDVEVICNDYIIKDMKDHYKVHKVRIYPNGEVFEKNSQYFGEDFVRGLLTPDGEYIKAEHGSNKF